MNLKKLFVVMMVITMSMAAHADGLSSKALNLRSQIKSYLATEGYTPSIDDDGDIKFKYNGYTYYISLADVSDDVVIRYMVGVTVPDSLTRGQANKLCLDLTQGKLCVRAILTTSGKTIYVQIDAFCSGISMFKSLFLKNMQLLDSTSDSLVESIQAL